MKSKRSQEGYFLLENRHGPAHTLEQAAEFKKQTGQDLIGAGNRGVFESATITCSHCHRTVVLNPQRDRERGYCPKCDHYICDACETVRVANAGACVTMNQIIDEIQEAGAKGLLGLFGPPKAPGSAPPSLVL